MIDVKVVTGEVAGGAGCGRLGGVEVIAAYAREHGCIDLYPELEDLIEIADEVASWDLPDPKGRPSGSSSSISLPTIDWPDIGRVWVGTDTGPARDWITPLLVGGATPAAAAAVVIAFGLVG